MKKRSHIFTICFSLYCFCMILPNGLLWSCGPSLAADESRFALFRNGLDGETGFRPFYYSENLFNLSEADPDSIDRKNNCKEWVSFCKDMVKEKDVYSIQYETTPTYFFNAYKTGNWEGFRNNSFIQWAINKNHKDALDYLALAKMNEQVQARDTDPWDTSSVTKPFLFDSIAVIASKEILHASSTFLKERYAFQAIKSLHYKSAALNSDNILLTRIFDENLENKRSIVSAWAKVYYATAQKDNNKRTLYLLKSFDECEEKKRFCFQQIDAKDLDQLEKATTDPHTLVLINVMRALKNKGRAIAEIKPVVSYEPNSKYLPLLFSREINKLENWLWSPEMLLFTDNYRMDAPIDDNSKRDNKKLKIQDTKYLTELRSYMESLEETKEGQKSYQQLALTHLYNIEHDTAKANHKLMQVAVQHDPLVETQRLIEKVITIGQSKDVTNTTTQELLASAIIKLKKLNPNFALQMDRNYDIWDHQSDNENNDDLSELYVLLSRLFKQKADIVTAGLLYNKANMTLNNYDGWGENDSSLSYRQIAYLDRFASTKDIDKLLQVKKQKHLSAFMKLIVPRVWPKDDFYKDLKGTIFFRQRKYQEALEVFSSMNPNFWEKNYQYTDYLPLTSVTHTGKMIPSERSKPSTYKITSKKLIVAEMVELQQAIDKTTDDSTKAILYYKLANAYFNTSYNGKAWMMYSYGKSSGEDYNGADEEDNYHWAWYNFWPNNKKYGADYYGCKTAISTYNKALSLTRNRELAAKCLLALSTCDNISASYNRTNRWENSNKYYSPYLKQLTAKYRSTNTFKEAAVECPDVRDYAAGRRSK